MPTVHIIVCNVPPNISTNTYGSACPISARSSIAFDSAQLSAGLVTVSVDRTHNQDSFEDMSLMFGFFILALVGIWGSKQLLNLFSTDTHRD